MKLYMIFVRDELRATHKSKKSALKAAEHIRKIYWPKLEIIEVTVNNHRTIKTYPAEPECDPLR